MWFPLVQFGRNGLKTVFSSKQVLFTSSHENRYDMFCLDFKKSSPSSHRKRHFFELKNMTMLWVLGLSKQVPLEGWVQIVLFLGHYEGYFWRQDPKRAPGDYEGRSRQRKRSSLKEPGAGCLGLLLIFY